MKKFVSIISIAAILAFAIGMGSSYKSHDEAVIMPPGGDAPVITAVVMPPGGDAPTSSSTIG